MKKRIIAVVAVVVIALSVLCSHSIAAVSENPDTVFPQNIIITSCDRDFKINSSGGLYLFGLTSVPSGYKAEVIVELQRYDGGWRRVTEYSATGAYNAIVDEDITPARGYLYRLKLSHKAYNSSWVLLETITKYSEEIEYF